MKFIKRRETFVKIDMLDVRRKLGSRQKISLAQKKRPIRGKIDKICIVQTIGFDEVEVVSWKPCHNKKTHTTTFFLLSRETSQHYLTLSNNYSLLYILILLHDPLAYNIFQGVAKDEKGISYDTASCIYN